MTDQSSQPTGDFYDNQNWNIKGGPEMDPLNNNYIPFVNSFNLIQSRYTSHQETNGEEKFYVIVFEGEQICRTESASTAKMLICLLNKALVDA